jgi:ATP-dependent DNA ligase
MAMRTMPTPHEEGGARAAYVAFDLPEFNGKDIRQEALEDRRAELGRIVASDAHA